MSECGEERQNSGKENERESYMSFMSSTFDMQMTTLEKSVGMPQPSIRHPLIPVVADSVPCIARAQSKKIPHFPSITHEHLCPEFGYCHDWENQYDNQVGRGLVSSFANI
jgi:hypothetical protein